jgi:outer membrane receptor protein involved in Fe transport
VFAVQRMSGRRRSPPSSPRARTCSPLLPRGPCPLRRKLERPRRAALLHPRPRQHRLRPRRFPARLHHHGRRRHGERGAQVRRRSSTSSSVEVYRGPQGTLFGRNTTAGIVRFTSVKPTEEFDYNRPAATVRQLRHDGRSTAGSAAPSAPGMSDARASSPLPAPRRLDRQHARQRRRQSSAGLTNIAGRLQARPTTRPTSSTSCSTCTRRDLDGTAADLPRQRDRRREPNGLNANYDARPRPTYDQRRRQQRSTTMAGVPRRTSATISATFTLTSITAYESTEGL